MRDVVETLRAHATAWARRPAIRYLGDGESVTETLTYADLDFRARQYAVYLQRHCQPGDRAVLAYENAAENVVAFLGCLYAGVIAVPVQSPDEGNAAEIARHQAILRHAKPAVVLTDASSRAVTDCNLSQWREPVLQADSLAFLQYTSGSTAAPKGVMVGHDNILANVAASGEGFETTDQDVVLSWLPLFHDMGLIGGVLHPLIRGVPLILMTPRRFIERPIRWLQAISKYRATVSGGPDFAYRLCVERIGETARETLDLSSWRVAFCGSEPIRAETVRRFADEFGPAGFDARAFYPCYGLAEATLFVTGVKRGAGARISEDGRVGCGAASS